MPSATRRSRLIFVAALGRNKELPKVAHHCADKQAQGKMDLALKEFEDAIRIQRDIGDIADSPTPYRLRKSLQRSQRLRPRPKGIQRIAAT